MNARTRPDPEVEVEDTAEDLATEVAARVIGTLAEAQRERGAATLVLTGGSILEAVFSALSSASGRAAAARGNLEWGRVDVFWGDERFVAAESGDRNDGPAARLLLDPLGLDAARIHPMPSTDGPDGADVDAAASRYADVLARAAGPAGVGDVPAFDVCLIGLGPDGHCCSLFPGHPGVRERERSVIGVRDSPKPPPVRISLTFRALDAAEQIWFIAAGEGKADAVAKALGGADPAAVPAAGPRGRRRALWLGGRAAAAPRARVAGSGSRASTCSR